MSTHDMDPPRMFGERQEVSKAGREHLGMLRTALSFASAFTEPLYTSDTLPTDIARDIETADELLGKAMKWIEHACQRARV